MPNNRETVTTRQTALAEPDAWTNDGSSGMNRADTPPASMDARKYFQTAPITGAAPRCIGLPAYHSAGIVRIQRDKVQLAAIPAGPQCRARRKRRKLNPNSTSPQRNQRSALPIERWIQTWVP